MPRTVHPQYLDELADLVRNPDTPTSTLSPRQLRDAWAFAVELHDRGVHSTRTRALGRAYAHRLSDLGPEEFDRRCLTQ